MQELQVQIDAVTQTNGGVYAFEDVAKNDSLETLTIAISNTGDEDLEVSVADIESGFEILSQPTSIIAAGDTSNLVIRSVTQVPGTFSRNVSITTNDPLATTFVLTLTLNVSEEDGVSIYTNRTLLNRHFGKINISKWSDPDGDENDNTIELAVYQMCVDATNLINALLENGYYDPPFNPVPPIIEIIATKKCGHMLYSATGISVEHIDKAMSAHEKFMMDILGKINKGIISLGADVDKNITTSSPFVYKKACND